MSTFSIICLVLAAIIAGYATGRAEMVHQSSTAGTVAWLIRLATLTGISLVFRNAIGAG